MNGEMQRRQQRLTVQLLQVMQLRVMREAACARSLQAAFETTRAHQLDAWTLGSRVMKLHAIGLAVSAEMLLHALQAAEQQQHHLQQLHHLCHHLLLPGLRYGAEEEAQLQARLQMGR